MPITGRSKHRYQTSALVFEKRAIAQALIAGGAVVAVLVLAILCCRYLLLGTYLDHIEGGVIISGWQYAHGDPLYGIQDGAPRFATYYGPLAYLAPMPALVLLGPDVLFSKITSILALLATVISMGLYFLRHGAEGEWRDGVFFLASALLMFVPVSFWVRPDPIETLIVAAAVISTQSRRRPIWVGICIGLAVNLKAHAGFYFLPILMDLWWTSGWRALAIAAIFAVASFIAPFLAPGISAHDYVAGLVQQVGARPQSSLQLASILLAAALLLLPMMAPLAAQPQPVRTKLYAAATVLTAALLLYPATFPGAGAYHLLPLVPVMADLRYRLRPHGIDGVLSPFLILLVGLLGARETSQLLASKRADWRIAEEALTLARENPPGTVQVGYGDNRRSYEQGQLSKTVLSLNSFPELINAQVLMELHQVGIEGSERWIPFLTECRIARWLMPKGEVPFATTSYFYDSAPLFSERFRRAFFANYSLARRTENFTVWECTDGRTKVSSQKG